MLKGRLEKLCEQFPTKQDCLRHLEQLRWGGIPICPYCQSLKQTSLENECRYHCNECNTSYSVTAKTVFHKSKVDLRKWFFLIDMVSRRSKMPSVREMAMRLNVNRNTACYTAMRLRCATLSDRELIERVTKTLLLEE
ncbi:MAG: transposase [Blastocatellia bacterium]